MFGKVDKKVYDEVVAERDRLSNELQTANDSLNTTTNDLNTANSRIEELVNEKQTLQNQVDSMNTTIADLNLKLSKRPGSAPTAIEVEEEPINTESEPKYEKDPVSEYHETFNS